MRRVSRNRLSGGQLRGGIVTPRMRRVSRNLPCVLSKQKLPTVTPRMRRVSRNQTGSSGIAACIMSRLA